MRDGYGGHMTQKSVNRWILSGIQLIPRNAKVELVPQCSVISVELEIYTN